MRTAYSCLRLAVLLLLAGVPLFSAWGQTVWYNPVADTMSVVQGRWWNHEIGLRYQRLPPRAETVVRKPVWDLSRQCAGLYVKFLTNAPSVEVKYKVTGGFSMPHMPATGVSGVDLYVTDCDGQQHWCAGRYSFGDTVRYVYDNLTYRNTHKRGSEYTLYLPLYNGVSFLQIGVPAGSRFDFVRPSTEKPVVVYGTSIAQGACASRPGMAWTNILQRRLDCPVVNLGFSGNGQLDEEVFRLLAEVDAAVYVIDCMPNMTGDRVGLIQSRLEAGLRLLRSKSRAPILLVEHDGYMGYRASQPKEKEFREPNEQLRAVYEKMRTEAAPLFYLTQEELGLSMDSQVDGIHASDLGMQQYADAYVKALDAILYPGVSPLSFVPCRQERDGGTYNWLSRHEEFLAYNAANQPDVVMIGNSITHYWGGLPYERKREADDVWRRLFKGRTAVNLGFGWDRIENIGWRLLHGELDGFTADRVLMMAGTNNLELDTDSAIVAGVQDLVRIVRAKQPRAQVYVVKILPRRGAEERLRRLNTMLEQALKDTPQVEVIDVGKVLLQRDGKIDEKLFSDGLHPNHDGYRRLAKALRPYVE